MFEARTDEKTAAAELIALLGWRAIASACISKQTGSPISRQAVYKWVKTEIPPEHVLTLEKLAIHAGGDVDRFAMRPDLHGRRPRGWFSPFAPEEQAV